MEKITIVVPLALGRGIESSETLKFSSKGVKFIKEIGNGTSKNRNLGVLKVKTKYVGFINGHTILDKNWLDEVMIFIKKYPQIDIFGGPQLNPISDNFFAKMSGYALSSFFGAASMSNRYKQKEIDLDANEFSLTSANLICKKKVFDKVKFDETIYPGEDPKFLSDAKKAGFKLAYTPNVIVYNKRRDSYFGLIQQIYTYGKMRVKKERNFIELLKNPVFFGPSLFLIYLLFLIFGSFYLFNILFFVPLLLYVVLALIFAFMESIKNNSFLSFFFLPFLFLTIHLSYGVGFLVGILKKVF